MQIDFHKYSSLRIGGMCEVGVICAQDLDSSLSNPRLVGCANNLLVAPDAQNLYILDKQFDYIKECLEYIEIGALTKSARIVHYFRNQNLGGVEFLSGLPGSLGGIIKMNAGLKCGGKMYEIYKTLLQINVNGIWRSASDFVFSYRNSHIDGVIFGARLKRVKGFNSKLREECLKVRLLHPKKPSCGSCFKNPSGDFAARLIESVGLRGHRIGDAAFSEQHANFLVNLGKATFEDAKTLIELAKTRVYEASGIVLDTEVVIFD